MYAREHTHLCSNGERNLPTVLWARAGGIVGYGEKEDRKGGLDGDLRRVGALKEAQEGLFMGESLEELIRAGRERENIIKVVMLIGLGLGIVESGKEWEGGKCVEMKGD